MKKKDRVELAVSIVSALFGCAILVGAWFLTKDTRCFVSDSYVAEATIISVESKSEKNSAGHRTITYSPKVRFTSKSGSEIEQQANWWSKHHYKQGETISLRVAGNEAYRFVENTFGAIWGFSLLLWYLGGGVILVGLFIGITTIIRIRNRQQPN
jgi:hypothetical protein